MQDSKKFNNNLLADVKTSSKVDMKHTYNNDGTETLLMVIEKDYFNPSSYTPVFKVDGVEYGVTFYFTADNVEEYSKYFGNAITKNIITLTRNFSHQIMDFRGFVTVITKIVSILSSIR